MADSNQDAAVVEALPETATQLPLYGLLAVGFMAAGHMTLKSERRSN
jgi:hypothetical protein